MHNQTKKGKLYGISSFVRKISVYMTTFSFNVGTSNRQYRLSVNDSYSYICLLLHLFYNLITIVADFVSIACIMGSESEVSNNDWLVTVK
jgi:hypothetical protein